MTDYKIDRAGADCELDDVPWERSHPELYGTADDYYDALSVLEKRGISPKHRCMLLAHLNAPNHTVTWENLAKACGYASYRSVNLQYGPARSHRGALHCSRHSGTKHRKFRLQRHISCRQSSSLPRSASLHSDAQFKLLQHRPGQDSRRHAA